jgi:ATP synthase F1 epsilon subunit
MSDSIHCTVVSPETALFEGDVEHFVVPGWDGEIGVYRRHAPLVARLGVGVVRLHDARGAVQKIAVRGGILQVKDDAAQLLVTEAVRGRDSDAVALADELEGVIARLQSPPSDEAYRDLLVHRRWLEIQLSMSA